MAEENNVDQSGTPAVVAEAKAVIEQAQATEASANEAIKAAQERADAVKAANPGTTKADSDMIAKLVQDRLEAELSGIKKSLDNAYAQRDESLAKVKAFEAKEKEAQLKRLADEGKHKEAYEIQLAEERAQNAALLKRNTELSRDVNVRDALRNYSFKNDKAAEMAFKEITSNLVQDENKQWVHRSGITVKDYCEAFSKEEDQSFLFKAKTNSGAGTPASTSGNGVPSTDNKPKSLFAMSQAEVLKMASEGKFGAIPK
jgi:hypothetical protein